eukprot:g3244.t1
MFKFAANYDPDEEGNEGHDEDVQEAEAKLVRNVSKALNKTCSVPDLVKPTAALLGRMVQLRPAERPTASDVVRDSLFEILGGGRGGSSEGGAAGRAVAAAAATPGGADTTASPHECAVCFDESNKVGKFVFAPCEHTTLCKKCTDEVVSSSSSEKKQCPLCRKPVERAIRIFAPS